MAIKSLQHSSLEDNIFYRSMLAGNAPAQFESDDFLEEVVLTSAASSVTFSGLDAYSDYKHLQIRSIAKIDGAGGTYGSQMHLNSDANSNYAWHRLGGDGSSVSSSGGNSQTYMYWSYLVGDAGDTNSYTTVVTDILDFSSTSKNTTIRTLAGNADSGSNRINLWSGLWNSTSAVTSIEVGSGGSTNLRAGSRFSLYGSKG